jgi:serine/threonine protein phosphatase PrpC
MVNYIINYLNVTGFFILDNFLGDTKSILFGVFDGHGGQEVMQYVVATLPEVILLLYHNYLFSYLGKNTLKTKEHTEAKRLKLYLTNSIG